MALPKLQTPTFTLKLPSTGEEITYRPFLAKEEKIMLIAKESDDIRANLNATKQLIRNCVLNEVDVEKFATFDVEYVFLKIYSKSVNNVVKINVPDEHDNELFHECEIRLDDVEVMIDEDHSSLIQLNDDITIKMRYPTLSTEYQDETTLGMIVSCLDCIMEGEDTIHFAKDYKRAELIEFVGSFTAKNMEQVGNFFKTLPYLSIDIKYTNTKGEVSTKEIRGFRNFFPS